MPNLLIALRAYDEHDGENLQVWGRSGEINNLYNLIKKAKIISKG